MLTDDELLKMIAPSSLEDLIFLDQQYVNYLMKQIDSIEQDTNEFQQPEIPQQISINKRNYQRKIYYNVKHKIVKNFIGNTIMGETSDTLVYLCANAGSISSQQIKQKNEFWDLIECEDDEKDFTFMSPQFHDQMQVSVSESIQYGYFIQCSLGHAFIGQQQKCYDSTQDRYVFKYICPMCKSAQTSVQQWKRFEQSCTNGK